MELNEDEYNSFEEQIQDKTNLKYIDYINIYKSVTKSCSISQFKELLDEEKTMISDKFRKEGNDAFNSKNYSKALVLYTRSIASASVNSNARGLGYANRCAVLKLIGKYKECIVDIKRAFDNNYPDLLKYKLLVRQAQCYKYLGQKKDATQCMHQAKNYITNSTLDKNKQEQLCCQILREFEADIAMKQINVIANYPQPPMLSYGANMEASSFSSAVDIKFDYTFGRHLVASRDINTGDVLLVEAPYAAVLSTELNYSHCNHCMAKCENMIPCDHCDWALYCSEKCKTEALNKYHASECKIATKCMQIIDQNNLQRCLHFIRILCTFGVENFKNFLKNKIENSEDPRTLGFINSQYLSNNFSTIYNLTTNITEIPNLMLFAACNIAIIVSTCFENNEFCNEIAAFCLRNILSLKNNAHDITHAYLNEKICYELIGAGIYACASLSNHSCDPNIFRVNYGVYNIMRAIRAIKKGEQIYDSYKMHFAFDIKSNRQSYLKNHYHFDCLCNACTENWPLYNSLPIEIELQDAKVKSLYDNMISVSYKCPENSLPVTKSNIIVFIKTIDNLCMVKNANLTQVFQSAQEDVRNYFKSNGNCIRYEKL